MATENLFDERSHSIAGLDRSAAVHRAASRRSPAVLARSHMVTPGSGRRVVAMIDLIDHPALKLRYLFRLAFPPLEITELSSGNGMIAYFWQRLKTFLRMLQSFERLEKDS